MTTFCLDSNRGRNTSAAEEYSFGATLNITHTNTCRYIRVEISLLLHFTCILCKISFSLETTEAVEIECIANNG